MRAPSILERLEDIPADKKEIILQEVSEVLDILYKYNICIDDIKILAEFTTQTNRHRNELYKYLWRIKG